MNHNNVHKQQRKSFGQLRIKKPRRGPCKIERLLRQYDRHLHQVAGLTRETRRFQLVRIRQFLRWRFGRRSVRLHSLKARDFSNFIQERGVSLKSSSLRGVATSLRSFLRYLHLSGRTERPWHQAVVCPPPWPCRPVPETFSEVQLRTFLKGFDRTQPIGRRNFAIALCLCRLGLRAMEVASLRLEDVDWPAQTLYLRETKTRRERFLPLPLEVAKAIQGYLQLGRPQTRSTALFVRHRSPRCKGQGSQLVRMAMRAALKRCGLQQTRVHILRHTVATRLHRKGVSLKIIADLLGHQSLDTTSRYTRVNLDELRQAALPWPGGWR